VVTNRMPFAQACGSQECLYRKEAICAVAER
jgi:hypothetical protein